MEVNYQMWVDWKNNPVTKAFYAACIERVEEAKDVLAVSAGQDNAQDNFYRGFIRAYIETLDFKVEEETTND